MTKVIAFALYGPLAASHRVRLSQYSAGLASYNVELTIHSLFDDLYLASRFRNRFIPFGKLLRSYLLRLIHLSDQNKYDIAFIQYELFPLFPSLLERRLLKIPYILDFDDAWFLRYREGRLRTLSPLYSEKFSSTLKGAAVVIAGNRYLMEYARCFNTNVSLIPSAVDTAIYRRKNRDSKTDKFTIGWIGTPSTAKYLDILSPVLKKLANSFTVRFIVVGAKAPNIPSVELIEIPWDINSEIRLINQFDVGVMPLHDDEWAKGKCAYKLIQYMACGIPVVASKIGANCEVVTSDCGILAESEADWIEALTCLKLDPDLRLTMGNNARNRILEGYSVEKNLPLLAAIIQSNAPGK